MQCDCCASSNTKKNGHSPKGVQRYLCRECGRAFQATHDTRGLSHEDRMHAVKLQQEGLGMRAIARVLDKGRCTVWNFLKKSELPLAKA
jgi:transposase-like protein